MSTTQENSSAEPAESRTIAITLKLTASERRALDLVAAARDSDAPATLLRVMSLTQVVAEAEHLKEVLAAGQV